MKIHLALCNLDRWKNNRARYFQPWCWPGCSPGGCSTQAGTMMSPVTRTTLAQLPIIQECVRAAHHSPVPTSGCSCWVIGMFYLAPELGTWSGMAAASPGASRRTGASGTSSTREAPCTSALPLLVPWLSIHIPLKPFPPSRDLEAYTVTPESLSPQSHCHECTRCCQHSQEPVGGREAKPVPLPVTPSPPLAEVPVCNRVSSSEELSQG